jgi:peptide/nickel transport system substrate-binding protein
MKRILAAVLGVSTLCMTPIPAMADTLNIGISAETNSIDPHFFNTSANYNIYNHVFQSLVSIDENDRLRPLLAESWKPLDDTTWEIKLRKGVTFSDGTPFTADDVLFNVKRGESGELKSASPTTRHMLDKEYKKIDDHTIHVMTKGPYPLLPKDLSWTPIVSRKHGEGNKTEDYNAGKGVIGTGPYKFVEWVSGDRVVFERNPSYWGPKPDWDRITYKVIKSGPSRVAALLNGDVDLINEVPTSDIERLAKDPKLEVLRTPSNRMVYFHIDRKGGTTPFIKKNDGSDFDHNPLHKWEVRKALSKAINRELIVDRIMEGQGKPAGQPAVDGTFGTNPDLKAEPYDPDGAKALLAKAGYPDGFKMTIHGPNGRYTNDAQIIQAVAQMYARIGIKAEVANEPFTSYIANAKNYSFIFFGFGSDTADSLASLLHTPDRTKNRGFVNRGGYSNPKMDDMLNTALMTLDDAKREKMLQDAVKLVIDDVAMIPLHFQMNVWAHRKGLKYTPRFDEQTFGYLVRKAS